ncbi:MAG: hypothetical protein ABGW55_00690, partial [Nitrosopumilus sp.]
MKISDILTQEHLQTLSTQLLPIIKLNNLIYENIPIVEYIMPETLALDLPTEFLSILPQNSFSPSTNTQTTSQSTFTYSSQLPQTTEELKQAIKDTLDYLTTQYINQKIQSLQEDLTDITSEYQYLKQNLLSQTNLTLQDIDALINDIMTGKKKISSL